MTLRRWITLVEAAALTPERIDRAIKQVASRHDGFGGNCAVFAVVLNKVLGGGGTYLCADSGEHYEYVDHVALRFDGNLYDGSGRISEAEFRRWAETEDDEPGDVFEITDDSILRYVDGTGGGITTPLDAAKLEADLRAALGLTEGVHLMENADMTREELVARFPGIEPDLAAVDDWMGGPVRYRLTTEPMARFAERAQELLDYQQAEPTGLVSPREERDRKKDRARTSRIMKAIRGGAPQWPIFLDTEDGFIMEGRHRIVAFFLLGLRSIPVVHVSKRQED